MSSYQTIVNSLQGRFFLRSHGGTVWVADRNSKDMLLVLHETDIVGRITPNDEVTFFMDDTRFSRDYTCQSILMHVGITEARRERPTNKQAFWRLATGHEVVLGDVFLHGVAKPRSPDITPHYNNLMLGLVVPDQFIAKELPKVPRAEIAKLRKHVEEQFTLAKVQARLLPDQQGRWNVPYGKVGTTTGDIYSAVHGNSLQLRAKFMLGTDQTFWRRIISFYSSPATLIDSCRSALYDAAGIRASS